MKHKGNTNYSRKEITSLKDAIKVNNLRTKPLTIKRLANSIANELNRPVLGVYVKLLSMTKRRVKAQRINKMPVEAPKVEMTKQVTFGKPTKIEISDAGMTFFFN